VVDYALRSPWVSLRLFRFVTVLKVQFGHRDKNGQVTKRPHKHWSIQTSTIMERWGDFRSLSDGQWHLDFRPSADTTEPGQDSTFPLRLRPSNCVKLPPSHAFLAAAQRTLAGMPTLLVPCMLPFAHLFCKLQVTDWYF
jgi:hypothetical protein